MSECDDNIFISNIITWLLFYSVNFLSHYTPDRVVDVEKSGVALGLVANLRDDCLD